MLPGVYSLSSIFCVLNPNPLISKVLINKVFSYKITNNFIIYLKNRRIINNSIVELIKIILMIRFVLFNYAVNPLPEVEF